MYNFTCPSYFYIVKVYMQYNFMIFYHYFGFIILDFLFYF